MQPACSQATVSISLTYSSTALNVLRPEFVTCWLSARVQQEQHCLCPNSALLVQEQSCQSAIHDKTALKLLDHDSPFRPLILFELSPYHQSSNQMQCYAGPIQLCHHQRRRQELVQCVPGVCHCTYRSHRVSTAARQPPSCHVRDPHNCLVTHGRKELKICAVRRILQQAMNRPVASHAHCMDMHTS